MDQGFYWIGVVCVGFSALYFVGAIMAALLGWMFKRLGWDQNYKVFWSVIVPAEDTTTAGSDHKGEKG